MRRTTRFVPAAVLAAALLTACGSAPVELPVVDVSGFVPTAQDQDPSTRIDGVVTAEYSGAQHVRAQQRVAYTFSPPIGGSHDQAWAACDGVVYDRPVRSENLVHSLEHGAVWIAYDPERVTGGALDALAASVDGQPYLALSPYPGLASPISLQSWGHQLAVDEVTDPRIPQFVAALRQNQYTHPEPGASCAEVGQGYFDRDDPPPFAEVPAESEIDGAAVVAES